MKRNLLVFIKNKVYMCLFKTKKVCNVIYCQSFSNAFENGNNIQQGKLLRFLWSSHLRSSIKKVILKISQNSQENTCVGVSISINLHVQACNFIKKGDSGTDVFLWIQRIFKNTVLSEHLWTTVSEFYKWKQSFWKRNF